MKTIKLSKRIQTKGQRTSYTPTLVNWENVCHAGQEDEYQKAPAPFHSVKNENWNKFTTIHMMNGKTIQVKESLTAIASKLDIPNNVFDGLAEKND